jgi:DNA-binding transcriptional LysR family regulator
MLDASLRRLMVFKTVVEEGGINRAAQRLGISEPSVSVHVRLLEEQLGPLFVRRSGRGLETTETGELLYGCCVGIFANLQSFEEKRKTIRDGGRHVTVVAQRTIAARFVGPFLARYLRGHPEARIEVHAETQRGVFEHLADGSADLGIAWSLSGATAMASTLLGWQEVVFVAAPGHVLARREVSPRELAEHAFVGPLMESQYSKLIAESAKAIGVPRLNAIIQVEDADTLVSAVCEGIGYTLMPAFVAAPWVAVGRLVRLRVRAEPIRWQIRLFVTDHHALSAVGEHVLRYLKRCSWRAEDASAVRSG